MHHVFDVIINHVTSKNDVMVGNDVNNSATLAVYLDLFSKRIPLDQGLRKPERNTDRFASPCTSRSPVTYDLTYFFLI